MLMTEDERRERTEMIAGLRELADWLEAHPDVPVWSGSAPKVEHIAQGGADELAEVARAGDRFEKDLDGSYFTLRRRFAGGVSYEAWAARDQVCERVETGETKTVEERDYSAAPVRTVERPVVEWRCPPSLLAAGEEAS